MKGLIAIPIVIGSVLLIAGGALFGIAAYKSSKNNTVETKEYKELEAFNKFDIDLTIADLEFKASTETKVVVDETKYDVHTVKVADNTLKIEGVNNRKWYEYMFNWNWFNKVKVTVYMPEGNYEALDVKTATGNVNIPANFSFTNFAVDVDTGNVNSAASVSEELKAKASTGNINLADLSAKSMDLKAGTGNLRLKNINVTEKINLNTNTGDIKLENVNCANYQSHSDTGDVDFNNVKVTNHIEVKNGTGHVKFVDSDAETLFIKTGTGDINLKLLTSKICQVKKSTGGNPHYPVSTTGGLCEVETGTGSVNITFPQ